MDLSLLEDFITETLEHLEEMETNLLKIEKEPDNRDALDHVFRTAHSIKGNAEYLGIEKMSDLSHRLESLLEILRKKPEQVTREGIDILFRGKDRLGQLIDDLAKDKEETSPVNDIIADLDRYSMSDKQAEPEVSPGGNSVTELIDRLRGILMETARTDVSEKNRHKMTDILNNLLKRPELGEKRCQAFEHFRNQTRNPLFSDDAGDMLAELNKLLDEEATEPVPYKQETDFGETTYADETDEELFVIYIQHLKENLVLMRSLGEELKKAEDHLPLLNRCVDTLESLKSSANYMDYRKISRIYEKWNAEIQEYRENLFIADDEGFKRFLDKGMGDYIAGVIRFFPQCKEAFSEVSEAVLPASVSIHDKIVSAKSNHENTSETYDSLINENVSLTKDKFFESLEARKEERGLFDESDLLGIKSETLHKADFSEEAGSGAQSAVIKQSLRVDSGKIDSLMNQAGELVVSRAGFSQLFNEMHDFQREIRDAGGMNSKDLKLLKSLIFKFNESILSLGRVANELQDGVMKIRMLPISRLFKRYPRLVRDLVQGSGKEVRLEISGEETELDKIVIEAIADPLVHIIRNAIDHGAETVSERKAQNKPEVPLLKLDACHESNHVVIEVLDDGRGIDPEIIKELAVKKFAISREELNRMNIREITGLITLPGFSTSSEITRTSGRGVGMDVVKKNIEKLNGSIDIDSIRGQGTRIRIKIPLTLAIIKALHVKVGIETFTIPLTNVEEAFQIQRRNFFLIEGIEVIRLRNKVLPLLRLSELFNIKHGSTGPANLYVVVVNTGSGETGLVVDELIGQEETVIKPLVDYLQENNCFSGATILGDGSISLILDIYELINLFLFSKTDKAKMGVLTNPGPESSLFKKQMIR